MSIQSVSEFGAPDRWNVWASANDRAFPTGVARDGDHYTPSTQVAIWIVTAAVSWGIVAAIGWGAVAAYHLLVA